MKRCGPFGATGAWGWLPLAASLCLTGCHSRGAQKPDQLAKNSNESLPCGQGYRCLTDQEVASAGLKLASVARSHAASVVRIGGRIVFDDLRVAHVVSPLSGRLAEVNVSLGEQVVRGQVLATLHAPQMGAIYADAASALADQVAAERDYARIQSLYAERAVALKQYEAAQNRRAQARATAAQAVERRNLLGAPGTQASDRYVLRAPIDGTVVARTGTTNSEVQGLSDGANQAPVLFTIGSLDSVWALGDAFPLDAAAIRPGNPVDVAVTSYPDKTYSSQVEWLAASVDESTNAVRVRCRLENADHLLKPEMTATLRITTSLEEGLWVSQRAVFRVGDTPHVFVQAKVAEGVHQFELRRVSLVRASADKRFLLDGGLSEGETIVVEHGIYLIGAQD